MKKYMFGLMAQNFCGSQNFDGLSKEIQDDYPEVRVELKVHVTFLHEGKKKKRYIKRFESLIYDWTRMKRVVD